MRKEIERLVSTTDVEEVRKEYVALLGTGMFWEFFPLCSGDWEKDKDMFLDFYKNRENGRKN